jgi:hypothetical protein
VVYVIILPQVLEVLLVLQTRAVVAVLVLAEVIAEPMAVQELLLLVTV